MKGEAVSSPSCRLSVIEVGPLSGHSIQVCRARAVAESGGFYTDLEDEGRGRQHTTAVAVLPEIPRTATFGREASLLFFFVLPIFVSVVCPTGPHPPLRLPRRPNRGHTMYAGDKNCLNLQVACSGL